MIEEGGISSDELQELRCLISEKKDYKGSVERLHEIILEFVCDFNYLIPLENEYKPAAQYAYKCLERSTKKLSLIDPQDVEHWTQDVLHCFDIILFKYIREVFKEVIPEHKNFNLERTAYNIFKVREPPYRTIGESFDAIYDKFIQFKHPPKLIRGEIRFTNRPPDEIQEDFSFILEELKSAVDKILKLYKKEFPHAVTEA